MTCDRCGLLPHDDDPPADLACTCDDPFYLDPELKAIEARDARCWEFGCRLHLADREGV